MILLILTQQKKMLFLLRWEKTAPMIDLNMSLKLKRELYSMQAPVPEV